MESVGLILVGIAVGIFIGVIFGRKHPKKQTKLQPKIQTISPEYNPDYLTAEGSFTVDSYAIHQYHHDKQLATYEQILAVDHNNASQCRKLVMINISAEENVNNSETINDFWDKLIKQNKLVKNRYYHIIVEQDNKFFVACAYLDSDGDRGRDAGSLAGDYRCCRWSPEYGDRFLLP